MFRNETTDFLNCWFSLGHWKALLLQARAPDALNVGCQPGWTKRSLSTTLRHMGFEFSVPPSTSADVEGGTIRVARVVTLVDRLVHRAEIIKIDADS